MRRTLRARIAPGVLAASVIALPSLVAADGKPPPPGPAQPGPSVMAPPVTLDPPSPTGTWHLRANKYRLALEVGPGPAYTGTIAGEGAAPVAIQDVSWNPKARILEFRRTGPGFHQWFRARVEDGILVGRFSHSAEGAKPAQVTAYAHHVTGWSPTVVDDALAPRTFELLIKDAYRARLRIGCASASCAAHIARLKVTSTVAGGAAGEELEHEVTVTKWDGKSLDFVRHGPGWTQSYSGVVTGRTVSGTATHGAQTFGWKGERAEVLGYGIAPRTPAARSSWQTRGRRRLEWLTMGGNPPPLSSDVKVVAKLAPIKASVASDRDDTPQSWPQNYDLAELAFTHTLASPYGTGTITRAAHGYLATPSKLPPGQKRAAVLALNGHGGSAYDAMHPTWKYHYGDAWARRGFVVLALDVGHRPPADRGGLYTEYDAGDHPTNPPHPAVKAAGMDSDWEEDGERTWDAMRGIDYLVKRPDVDPSRIVVTGLSMGGEIAASVAGLDAARVRLAIAAGYSPDLGVIEHHGNHGCWGWVHASIGEYIDVSDLYALRAPLPLVVETGTFDGTFSSLKPAFSADRQVLRRVRAAYGAEVGSVRHVAHGGQHVLRFGEASQESPQPKGLAVFATNGPSSPADVGWQTDPTTTPVKPPSLFDVSKVYLGLACPGCADIKP
jgi:dienelactone hydrolase